MRLINYLVPKILYHGSSKYSKDIKVIKVGGTIKLVVNGIVQSLGNNSGLAQKKVWGKVTQIINEKKPSAKKFLLLGMGGGTMIHMLNKKFGGNNIDIMSVEIDPVIVNLSKKFFGMDLVKNNEIIVADAFDVVSNPKKYKVNVNFDCVIVDTYTGGEYPLHFSTRSFHKNLFNLVDTKGLVVINRIILKGRDDIVENFKNELKPFIDSVKIRKVKCPVVSDNYIYYGFKKSTP